MATHFDSNGNSFLSEELDHVKLPFGNSAYSNGFRHTAYGPMAFYSPHIQFPTVQSMYYEGKNREYGEGYVNGFYNSGVEGYYQYQSPHFHALPNWPSFVPNFGYSNYGSDVEHNISEYYDIPGYEPLPYYYTSPSLTSAGGSVHLDHYWYPNLDHIRHTHSLFRFIAQVSDDRRSGSLGGMKVDIVEEITGEILCHAVPKRMLVLFFGRQVVSQHLFTTGRDIDDRVNPRGFPLAQKFLVSAQSTSGDAWRILVAWMKRACGDVHRRGQKLRELGVPRSLFAAVTLARTLRYMGLNIDAHRIDVAINEKHLYRPLDLDTVKAIWNGISKKSKYTWRLINVLKDRYELPMDEALELLPDYDEMTKWFDENPELRARMWRPELNDEFKPRSYREISDHHEKEWE